VTTTGDNPPDEDAPMTDAEIKLRGQHAAELSELLLRHRRDGLAKVAEMRARQDGERAALVAASKAGVPFEAPAKGKRRK
jgi:hypothetical protein